MTPARPGRGRGGYTLVALLVGMTVASILIAAVLPLASAQAQREREAELIFRGLQYAEGIRVFRRRFGRYPNALKELAELKPRSVRRLWKDPMTKDGEFAVISLEGTPVATPGGTGPGPKPTPRPTPTPSPFRSPGPGDGGTTGPVLGVRSRSTEKGYRLWEGRELYSEWRFTEASLATQGAAGSQQDMGPGPGIGGGGNPLPPGGGRK